MRIIAAILGIALCPLAFFALREEAKPMQRGGVSSAEAKNNFSDEKRSSLWNKRVDFHTHIGAQLYDLAEKLFEEVGTQVAVNLTGVPDGPLLDLHLQQAQKRDGRFIIFTGIDWRLLALPDFGERAADAIERAVKKGAKGVKISKALGLALKWPDGSRVAIDDKRLAPVFERIAKLKVPVAIHVADPAAFWEKPDEHNERFDELGANPHWGYFSRDDVPPHREIFEESLRLFKRHKDVQFVSVHVGGFPENVSEVKRLLDECKNVSVDIAARVPEIGRWPVSVGKAFFERYQDRIIFGTDFGLSRGGIMLGAPLGRQETRKDFEHFFSSTRRYLESKDKNFAHPTPIQGRWKINGIHLATSVLEKLYFKNARRLLQLDQGVSEKRLGK